MGMARIVLGTVAAAAVLALGLAPVANAATSNGVGGSDAISHGISGGGNAISHGIGGTDSVIGTGSISGGGN